MKNSANVLFICTGNPSIAAMAQALLKHHGKDGVEVYRLDATPSTLDNRAFSALEHFGIKTDSLRTTPFDEISTKHFDLVIQLRDKKHDNAATDGETRIKGADFLTWDVLEPQSRQGANPFEKTLQALNEHIKTFLLIEQKQTPSPISPTTFYKALADDIRLKTLLIIAVEKEVCVCELMIALNEESQPKVSRHLAQLRKSGILSDSKHQQWVFYSINPALPQWMKQTITSTVVNEPIFIEQELARLNSMGSRPTRVASCCN